MYLDNHELEWQYEPRRFYFTKDGKEMSYAPDFGLAAGEYIEVKGLWWKDARARFDAFVESFPAITVKLWDKEALMALGIVNRHGKVCYGE